MKFPLYYLFLAVQFSTVVAFTANLPAYAKQGDNQFSLSGIGQGMKLVIACR
ncbi:MAG: hypothetical protein U0930_08645 [Pirellulales bacterium]